MMKIIDFVVFLSATFSESKRKFRFSKNCNSQQNHELFNFEFGMVRWNSPENEPNVLLAVSSSRKS